MSIKCHHTVTVIACQYSTVTTVLLLWCVQRLLSYYYGVYSNYCLAIVVCTVTTVLLL